MKKTLRTIINVGGGTRMIEFGTNDSKYVVYMNLTYQGGFINSNPIIFPLKKGTYEVCWRRDFDEYWPRMETMIYSLIKPDFITLVFSERSDQTLPYRLSLST